MEPIHVGCHPPVASGVSRITLSGICIFRRYALGSQLMKETAMNPARRICTRGEIWMPAKHAKHAKSLKAKCIQELPSGRGSLAGVRSVLIVFASLRVFRGHYLHSQPRFCDRFGGRVVQASSLSRTVGDGTTSGTLDRQDACPTSLAALLRWASAVDHV